MTRYTKEIGLLPAWRNGQRTRLLIWGFGVRVPAWVIFFFHDSCTSDRLLLIVSISQTRNPRPLLIVSVSTNGFFTCTRNPALARNPKLALNPKSRSSHLAQNPNFIVNPKSPSSHLAQNPKFVVNPKTPSSHLTRNPILVVTPKIAVF